eukprot:842581_1
MSKGSIRTLCIPPTPFCTFLLILSLLQITIPFQLIYHGFIQSIKNKKTLPQLYKIIYWITSFFLLISHGFIQSIKNKKTLPQLYKIIYWITSFFLLISHGFIQSI